MNGSDWPLPTLPTLKQWAPISSWHSSTVVVVAANTLTTPPNDRVRILVRSLIAVIVGPDDVQSLPILILITISNSLQFAQIPLRSAY